MSTPSISTQNSTHFYLTQEIWKQAWHSQDSSSMTALCAKVACIVFPIILSVAIVEAIVWTVRSVLKVSTDPKSAPLDPQTVKQALTEVQQTPRQDQQQQTPVSIEEPKPIFQFDTPVKQPSAPQEVQKTTKDDTVKNPNIITLVLPAGSSVHDIRANKYDPENVRPPAGTYHALLYAYYANLGFNLHISAIEEGNIDEIAKDQRNMIELGTRNYFTAIETDPSIKEHADLNTIRLKDAQFLRSRNLYFEPANQEPLTVAERSLAIVEHLFIPQKKPVWPASPEKIQIALLELGNFQTIALVCLDDRVIVFNSDKNERTMTIGKEATQAYLTDMLGPYPYFSYALGQYDRTRKNEEIAVTVPAQQQKTEDPVQIEPAIIAPEEHQDIDKSEIEPWQIESPVIAPGQHQDIDESVQIQPWQIEPDVIGPEQQQSTVETVQVEKSVEKGKNPHIMTLALPVGSSLHDIVVNKNDPENERPPADAYHALQYLKYINMSFSGHADRINEGLALRIAEDVRQIIEFGTYDYFHAVGNEPSLKNCADLDGIREKDSGYLLASHLRFGVSNHDSEPVAERAQTIVEHLFIPQDKPKDFGASRKIVQIALLKNSENQTMALAGVEDRVIVFNSNKNEITMTVGKQATQEYLTEMLGARPFSYALGQYNSTV